MCTYVKIGVIPLLLPEGHIEKMVVVKHNHFDIYYLCSIIPKTKYFICIS